MAIGKVQRTAAKLIRACRKGRFGLLFQQQVEQERAHSGGMTNGCCMRAPYSGTFSSSAIVLACLQNAICLTQGLQGDLFNHLIDELAKCPTLKQKVEKARESRPGSHRRTTEWLCHRVEIALELHQQKISRQEFDRAFKGQPQVLGPNTQLPKGADPNAAPALTDLNVPAALATREKKKKKKDDPEVPATPAAKIKGKGKGDATRHPKTHTARRGQGRQRRHSSF